jgi:hypothetical protein
MESCWSLTDITVYKDRETLQVERLHVLQKTLDKTVELCPA